jgi:uncharacterized protein YxeA
MDITDEEKFNNIEGVVLSGLQKLSSTLLAEIVTVDVELSNVFYNMQPTKLVPFMSWNNIYKIYRGFKPPSTDWLTESSAYISIKYVKTLGSVSDIQYGESKIEINPNTNKPILFFHHEVYEKVNYEQNIVFDILTDAIGFSIGSSAEKDVVSLFDVPNQEIQYNIFKDLILTDPVFINYFTIDDSYQTKKKYLTIRFYPSGKQKSFTFTITQQTDNGMYLHVKIKGQHAQSVITNFTSVMSKIFKLYNDKKQGISDIYMSYGIDIRPAEVIKQKTGNQTTGFSRRCAKEKQPTRYDTEQDAIDVVGDKQGAVMKFPFNGVDKYYVCTKNPSFTYPGLTTPHENDTGVACCFKKKQVTDDKSQYSKYINGEGTTRSTITPHVLSGNKLLGPTQQAELPDKLKRLFDIKLPSRNHSFMRYGVELSPRSVIRCIGKALTINEDEYKETPVLAKQEMYDYSTKEIASIFENDDSYVDPRLMVTLLGETDDINIFMFDKNGMIKPRYRNGYYKRKNNYKSVIIYEQPRDNGTYSQWEIMALVTGKNKQFIFDYDDDISVWLRDMLYRKTGTTVNNIMIPRFSGLPIPTGWKIKSQMFDASGKTRILKCMSPENEEFVFQTSPLQPLNYPESIVNSIKPYGKNKQDKFITFAGTDGVVKIKNNIMTIEISNGVSLSIPLEIVVEDPDDIQSPTLPVNDTRESSMRENIKYNRISRYIVEYAKWMFSKYGDKQNTNLFMEERVKIIDKYKYTELRKNFTESSGVVVNGKLIADSVKTKKKIKFIIEMLVLRTPSIFDKYKTMIQVPGYHSTITDFRKNFSISAETTRDVYDYKYNVFYGKNTIDDMLS